MCDFYFNDGCPDLLRAANKYWPWRWRHLPRRTTVLLASKMIWMEARDLLFSSNWFVLAFHRRFPDDPMKLLPLKEDRSLFHAGERPGRAVPYYREDDVMPTDKTSPEFLDKITFLVADFTLIARKEPRELIDLSAMVDFINSFPRIRQIRINFNIIASKGTLAKKRMLDLVEQLSKVRYAKPGSMGGAWYGYQILRLVGDER